MKLDERILKEVKDNKNGIKFKNLAKKLRISSEKEKDELRKRLNNLNSDNRISYDRKKDTISVIKTYKGIIKIDKITKDGLLISSGKAFIIRNDKLNGALDGDTVLIRTTDDYYNNMALGYVDKIVARKDEHINCTYENEKLYSMDNSKQEIRVPKSKLVACNNGDIINVDVSNDNKFTFDNNDEKVKTVLESNDKYYLQKKIALCAGFPLEFSDKAMEEAEKLPKFVSEEEIKGRVDLRNLNIFTIDCDNTKDMDDAVYVEKIPNGNYKLYISIADVNYYVNPFRSPTLDREAQKRGCSVYLDPIVVPMLPASISNGICSLNPNEDKLTITTIVEIDKSGNIVGGDIVKSVINSRAKMKYSLVNQYFNDNDSMPIYKNELGEILNVLKEASEIMGKNLEHYGKKEFVKNEIEVNLDEENQPTEFINRDTGIAQKLIENFMIYANIYVASTFLDLNEPCIYRIHELPNEEKLIDISNQIKRNSCLSMIKRELHVENLEVFLRQLSRNGSLTNQTIISNLILRCMARAKYSTENCGHYGLGLETYCHSTSPIRRYSDLIIQRLLDDRMKRNNLTYFEKNDTAKLTNELNKICNTINEREIAEDQAEKDLLKVQMIQYMSQHVGEIFNATIANIGPSRIDIILDNNITGFANLNDVMFGNFQYNANKNIIIDPYSGRKLCIGDKILVYTNGEIKNEKLEFVVDSKENIMSRTLSRNCVKSY